MIDIETLAVTSDAVICTLGAVRWDESGQGQWFYQRIAWEGRAQPGRVICPSTTARWMCQSDSARHELTAPGTVGRLPLQQTLIQFSQWLQEQGPADRLEIWGRGSLDINVLEHAYLAVGLDFYGYPVPWKPTRVRDVRTLLAIAGVESPKTASHHALDDCRKQIAECQEALTLLGRRGRGLEH
jgi:hypothetical protein